MTRTTSNFSWIWGILILVSLTLASQDNEVTISHLLRKVRARNPVSDEKIRIPNVMMPNKRSTSTLVVEEFSPVSEDFKYYSPKGNNLEEVDIRPSNTYFQGNIEGDEDSIVVLTVTDNENAYGWTRFAEGSFVLKLAQPSEKRDEPYLSIVPSETNENIPSNWCGSDHSYVAPGAPEIQVSNETEHFHPSRQLSPTNILRVASECDITYWNYFNNSQLALNYVTDIMATVSGIYSRDLSISVQFTNFICSASAYSYGTSNNNAALQTVSQRWRQSYSSITRDVVALLLGANVGGLGYVRSACTSTYGYSVSGITKWLPSNHFDYILVAHEIGHNIGSSHTHCYNPPIDNCYSGESGCYSGPVSVPRGGGSIMSYCHTVAPGYTNNLQMYMGAVGQFGTNSERVNNVIRSFIGSSGGSSSCLPRSTSRTARKSKTKLQMLEEEHSSAGKLLFLAPLLLVLLF